MKSKIELHFAKDGEFADLADPQRSKAHQGPNKQDSIVLSRFIGDAAVSATIEEKITGLPEFRYLPSSHGDMYVVPAKDTVLFLDLLLEFTTLHSESLFVCKRNWGTLTEELIKNGYLTTEQLAHYDQSIPLVALEHTEKNHPKKYLMILHSRLCLKTAQSLKDKGKWEEQIQLLVGGHRANSRNPLFIIDGRLQAFLHGITWLNLYTLLQEEHYSWLTNELAVCPTFTKMVYSCSDRSVAINTNFVNFLARTTSIQEIEIYSGFYLSAEKASLQNPQMLVAGLQKNRSVNILEINNIPIGDQCLKMIIDALAANPANKISELNFNSCDITDFGVRYLLNRFDSFPSLAKVEVFGNHCSQLVKDLIKDRLSVRKQIRTLTVEALIANNLFSPLTKVDDVKTSAITLES